MAIADLNFDGWEDLILGADRASPPGRAGAGEIYVFFGCGIVTRGGAPPLGLVISPGHPNPFNSSVTFDYTVPERSALRVTVYDVRGRRVTALAPERYRTSAGSVSWDGRDDRGRRVPSGTYFVRMETGAHTVTRKVILLR
jgi:hypothetical protein